jgi:hypothetical protein
MSAIPPNLLSSVVGGLSAQGRAAGAKAKSDADQTRVTDPGAFADRLADAIENVEADAEVNPDAEGLGGRGRAFTDQEAESDADEAPPGEEAGGLDLQA